MKYKKAGRPPKAPVGDTFAARLRRRRLRSGMRVEDLAAAVEVAPGTWWAWELGHRRGDPPLSLLRSIAAVLGCRVEDLAP